MARDAGDVRSSQRTSSIWPGELPALRPEFDGLLAVAVADEGGALDLDGEEMKLRLTPRDPLRDGGNVAPAEIWIVDRDGAPAEVDFDLVTGGRTDGVTQQETRIA